MTTSLPDGSSATPDPQNASLGELFSRLANDTSTLVKQQISLLRAEMTEKIGSLVGSVIKLVIAGVFALLAVLVLLAAAVIGLGVVLGDRYWLSALIIGTFLLVLAAIFGLMGAKSLKKAKPIPTQTIETFQEDAQWLKEQIKR